MSIRSLIRLLISIGCCGASTWAQAPATGTMKTLAEVATGLGDPAVVAGAARLAPGRAAIGIAVDTGGLDALVARLRPELEIDLSVYSADPTPAARHGLGWICGAEDPGTLAKRAGDAGVTGRLGLHLPVCVHPDPARAHAATHEGLLAASPLVGVPGAVVGGADALGDAIDAAVAAGVTRIVIENVLPFGEESSTSRRRCFRQSRHRPHGGP